MILSLLLAVPLLAGSVDALDGEITVGIFPSHIHEVHPARSTSYYDLVYLSQIGQTLVEQNEVAEIIPGIAMSWEISPDRKIYRFKIRQGLSFHDGTPLQLEDIVYSLNQAIYSTDNASYYYLNVIEGYEKGRRSKQCPGIRALPSGFIEVRLTRPYTPLLRSLTSGAMVIGKKPSSDKTEPFIGTGAYRLKRAGKDAYLEAFPRYLGPYPPKIKKIRLVADTEALIGKKKLLTADLPDFFVLYLEDQMGPVDSKEYRIVRRPGMLVSGFYINQKSPHFMEKESRARLIRALRSVALKNPPGVPGVPLEDVYPVGMLGNESGRNSFKTLAQTSDAAGDKMLPKEITIGVISLVEGGNDEFARRFKEETGVSVSFLKLTHQNVLEEINELKADVYFLKWKSVFLDPETSLTPFQFVKAFELSPHRKRFEKLRQDATEAVINEDRVKKYGEIADLIFSEALYLPVYQRDELQAVRKKISFSGSIYRYSPMFSELELKNGE